MKKTLIALAALAASGVALAQSSVTVYGVVDVGISQNKDTLSGANVRDLIGRNAISSKSTGMKSVLSGSRFGFRGVEDLGGGLKADFTLEYAVQPDEAGTSMANRQSFVGLSGGFGAVKLGRQNTPFHNVQAALDVAGNADAPGYVLALHNRARASNALRYDLPKMGGFNAAVMYSFGEQNTVTNGNTRKGDGFGLNATYADGPLRVGFAYDQVKNPAGDSVSGTPAPASVIRYTFLSDGSTAPLFGTNGSSKVSTWALGGAYDFGAVKVTGGVSTLKDSFVGGGNVKSNGWYLGVSVPMGAITAYAGVGGAKLKEDGETFAKYNGYQVGMNYAMSKRTTAYALYGYDRLRDSIENFDARVKRTQFSVGIRHTF
jgi:predicted porin